jgi:NADPH:quinone reductase-like Zn-dependent oxidoreductase
MALNNPNAHGPELHLHNGKYSKPSNQTMCTLDDLKHDFFLKKSVLITGASSGIGRALAYWYLNHGAKVALVGRDIKEMNELAS